MAIFVIGAARMRIPFGALSRLASLPARSFHAENIRPEYLPTGLATAAGDGKKWLSANGLRHESRVRDREQLDLSIDPPPDLAIEIDVTSPSVNRLSIYAALGVPEVWRWRQDGIDVYALQGDAYHLRAGSGALPGFPINEAAAALARRLQADDNTLTKANKGGK